MQDSLLSREEVLSGNLNRGRRAAKVFAGIEARCRYTRDEMRRAVGSFLTEGSVRFQSGLTMDYFEGLKLVARSSPDLLSAHLDRFVSQWKLLVPPDPEIRARVIRLIHEKYGAGLLTCAALGAGEQPVRAAYQQLYGESIQDAPWPAREASASAALDALDAVELLFEWLSLASAEILYQEGDSGESLYVVISGRVRASSIGPDGGEQCVAEMGRGELVGELEILTGNVRSTTVRAVRDSELVRLSRDRLLALAQRNVHLLVQINAVIAGRLCREYARTRPAHDTLITITLVPCDASVPLDDLGGQLVAELERFGPTTRVTAGALEEAIDPGAAQVALDDPRNAQIMSWLTDLEAHNRYVVYEAAPELSEWSRRCIRQADQILLVGRADAASLPLAQETALLPNQGQAGASLERVDLVMLHDLVTPAARGTAAWLAPRGLRTHHHVRLGNRQDIVRLARRLTGRAFGLVLGGGGARGFGHIGVLRALREAGIVVDEIGGTSMGALIAAGHAMGMDDAALCELGLRIGSHQALLDRSLPIVSMYATRKITDIIHRLSGGLDIEDLWLPYFCISCNLSRGEQMVHARGQLWQAVRASMAAAPIFAPVVQDGDLLVDGGFLNNVPVDVMRQRVGSGLVLGVDCSPISARTRPYDFGPSISTWDALRYRLSPDLREKGPPSMVQVFAQIMDTNGLYRQQFTKDAADLILRLPTRDYGMLDFEDATEIIEAGYRGACETLPAWLSLAEQR